MTKTLVEVIDFMENINATEECSENKPKSNDNKSKQKDTKKSKKGSSDNGNNNNTNKTKFVRNMARIGRTTLRIVARFRGRTETVISSPTRPGIANPMRPRKKQPRNWLLLFVRKSVRESRNNWLLLIAESVNQMTTIPMVNVLLCNPSRLVWMDSITSKWTRCASQTTMMTKFPAEMQARKYSALPQRS